MVVSTAGVQHVYGTANWGYSLNIDASAQWFEYVATSFLLSGVINGDAFDNNCLTRCSPDQQTVDACQNDAEFPGTWDWEDCECVRNGSPIIIDLDSDGLSLTGPSEGVAFDLLASGQPVQVGWTTPIANDAFLALDRNGNGQIDDGAELFGDRSLQPDSGRKVGKHGPNGFLALREFDRREAGGNADEQISEQDEIYQRLRLWMDTNHDGVAQAGELSSLPSKGVRSISLRYQRGQRTDEFGNIFRFLSHVAMDQSALSPGPIARQAIDVFLSTRGFRRRSSGDGDKMITMRHDAIALALFVSVFAVCANATAPRPGVRGPITSMSLPVSESVLATIVSADKELVLLALWRGEKGWHSRGVRQESGGARNGTFTAALQYGDVQLELAFDPAGSQATVQGRKVSMPARSNVLLIDGVDKSTGASSVKALILDAGDANVDPRKGSLAPLLGRSSEVASFLRCDDADTRSTGMPCHELAKR